MKITVDYSRDGIDWDEYAVFHGEDVIEEALGAADELTEQGFMVNVWNEMEEKIWEGGGKVPAWKQISPFEKEWLDKGGRLSPVVMPEDQIRELGL